MIYFDHNATTPLLPEVIEVMQQCMTSNFANPSSLHYLGRQARAVVEEAREKLAALINAHPSQIIFTSGGTESNNLALKGAVEGMKLTNLGISSVEHSSVRDVAKYLSRTIKVAELEVNSSGVVEPDVMKEYVKALQVPGLVSVMLANNETGVVQDVSALCEIVRQDGHMMHTDAVQMLGKLPVDFKALNVNLMSLSAHKLNGPKGAGALVYDKSVNIEPVLHGGGQERGLRSGTENLVAIVGFGKAAEIACDRQKAYETTVIGLRIYLEARLMEVAGVMIFAEHARRLPNTVFFGLSGLDGETLLMQLDNNSIAVTSGSACSSKSGKPSRVLLAMGVDEVMAQSAIRISLGIQNTRDEVDYFIHTLKKQSAMISSFNM